MVDGFEGGTDDATPEDVEEGLCCSIVMINDKNVKLNYVRHGESRESQP